LNDDILVHDLKVSSADAELLHGSGTLTVESLGLGEIAGHAGTYIMTGGTLNVTAGSTHGNDGLQIGSDPNGSSPSLGGVGAFDQSGGIVNVATALRVGFNGGVGVLNVAGSQSVFHAVPDGSSANQLGVYIGVASGTGTVLFSDGATTDIGRLSVGAAGGTASLHVRSGASLQVNSLQVGTNQDWMTWNGSTLSFGGHGEVVVADEQSALTVRLAPFRIGDDLGGSGIVRVEGGMLHAPPAAAVPRVEVRPFGKLEVAAGTATLDRGLLVHGGQVRVQSTGLLRTGSTTVRADGTITIDGGSFEPGYVTLTDGTLRQTGGTYRSNSTLLIENAGLASFEGGSTSVTFLAVRSGRAVIADGTVEAAADTVVQAQGLLQFTGAGQANVGDLRVLGGAVQIAAGAPITPRASRITVTDGGYIDLSDGSMVSTWDTPQTVAPLVASGHASGAWDGSGIRSGTAANNPRYAVGFAYAHEVLTEFPATFGNAEIDYFDLLLRGTLFGDATLDGIVNSDDFNRLAASFGSSGKFWSAGNFNYDPLGVVNSDDFNLLAANFGLSVGPDGPSPADWAQLAALVPEPSTGLLLLGGLTTSVASARRRRL